ncbi:MAG: hypothetical protein LBQ57_02780 [Spirochaetales bacterium]|nr:hypothetical protein [Spirochaetales bacterium]
MALPVLVFTVFILIGCTSVTPAPRQEASRPSPVQADGEVSEDKQEAPQSHSGLSPAELPLFVNSHLPASKKPVTRGGSPLAFIRRGETGGDTVVLLAVRTGDTRKAAFTYVSDFGRLFDSSTEELQFSVEVFTLSGDGQVTSKSIDAGAHRVCGSFSELPFPAQQAFPCGVSLVFPDTEGRRNIWILFPGGEGQPDSPQYSVFSFYEQANVKALVQDIDDNGMFDLLLFEDIFEESSGYETYITWYRWNGQGFGKYESTNVIRKLRGFFERSRQLLLSRDWKRFFDYALLPRDADALWGGSAAASFRRIFRTQEGSSVGGDDIYNVLFPQEAQESEITDAVFPNVVENPFPLTRDGPSSFPFTIRITANEENYFFSARLAMNKNPFSGRMFHFLPDE